MLEGSRLPGANDRRNAGLSHLAFHAGDQQNVDRLWHEAPAHGWSGLYKDRHPWAGGEPSSDTPGHYAAFLENEERFKIELVAASRRTLTYARFRVGVVPKWARCEKTGNLDAGGASERIRGSDSSLPVTPRRCGHGYEA